jgi:hypothetical protein
MRTEVPEGVRRLAHYNKNPSALDDETNMTLLIRRSSVDAGQRHLTRHQTYEEPL